VEKKINLNYQLLDIRLSNFVELDFFACCDLPFPQCKGLSEIVRIPTPISKLPHSQI
jgi:hypothetical protein